MCLDDVTAGIRDRGTPTVDSLQGPAPAGEEELAVERGRGDGNVRPLRGGHSRGLDRLRPRAGLGPRFERSRAVLTLGRLRDFLAVVATVEIGDGNRADQRKERDRALAIRTDRSRVHRDLERMANVRL